MSLNPDQLLDVIESLENFLTRKRPPENFRHELDLAYSIEDQSIRIFEIRSRWNDPDIKIECNVAKATYIKSRNIWKVYWLKADLKWHKYEPKSEVKKIDEFIKLVEEDKYYCFWG